MACKDITRDMDEDMIEIPENAAFTSRQHNTFNELRIGDELTDFTIISEGQKFPCHGVIIAASCSMFRGALETSLKESTTRQMELPDIAPNVVSIILEYIYKRTIRVPSDLLLATIKAANYLHLHELQNDCLQRAQRVLKPSNVISWHRVVPQLNDEDLKERCSKLLLSSLPDVAKSSEFCELSLAELNSYFDDLQDSDVDCDDKVDAVIRWICHSPTSRNDYMQELVLLIDLMQCSIQCLEEAIQNHLDLMDEEMRLKFAENVAILSQQGNSRVKRGKIILVVIAGHEKTCWRVEKIRNLEILCKDFQCKAWHSVCQVPQGFLMTGGVDSNLCMMYVASSRSWKQLTSMQAPRHAHASIYMQIKVFIFGGYVSNRESKSVQSLQLDGGEWVEEPALPVDVLYPAVAQINLNMFLLDTNTNHLFCLNPKLKVWRPMSKCPGLARRGTRMISVNGQLLACGMGRKNHGTCARYTPGTDSWVSCRGPFKDHCLGALICHNDRIFLIGGEWTDAVEEYDMVADKWDVCDWELPKKVVNLHAVFATGI